MRIEKVQGGFSEPAGPTDSESTPNPEATTSFPNTDQLEVAAKQLNFTDGPPQQFAATEVDSAANATTDPSMLGGTESIKFSPDVQSAIDGNTLTLNGPDIAKTSPSLAKACATGAHFKEVVLHLARTSDSDKPEKYFILKLTDAYVSSYQQSSSSTSKDDRPVESLSLTFAKIEFE